MEGPQPEWERRGGRQDRTLCVGDAAVLESQLLRVFEQLVPVIFSWAPVS